jgi:hypothetical protein
MICHYVFYENAYQIYYFLSLAVRYKPSILGKSISYYYDSVIGFISYWIGR